MRDKELPITGSEELEALHCKCFDIDARSMSLRLSTRCGLASLLFWLGTRRLRDIIDIRGKGDFISSHLGDSHHWVEDNGWNCAALYSAQYSCL